MSKRLIDAEAAKNALYELKKKGISFIPTSFICDTIDNVPTIEAKPVVHAHWISASWEEDEENGIENTDSDEFICSNCKEHLYFPDAIEKEDIGFSFCPYCGAQMDEVAGDINVGSKKGVKIPVISMEDVPKMMEEMEKSGVEGNNA